ncbi:MAG TPA: ATP-dependent DNA ligase [Roseiflexaceae bacterium]|nr:ATP-dependent DNA ligase [Roseiflexaceae bacterium]
MRFADLARTFDALEATSSRRELVALLAEALSLAADDELQPLIYLCQGRLAATFIPIEFGMADKTVADAIGVAYDADRAAVLRRYDTLGDLGLIAAELRAARPSGADRETAVGVLDVYTRLHEIAQASGEGSIARKVELLAALLREVDALGAKHLVRIPLGRMRLGIGDPTILEALALAHGADSSLRPTLEAAYNRTSDLGLIGRTLRTDGPAAVAQLTIRPGNPIRPALAERLGDAAAILARLGRCAVEPKFDGFRLQVHRCGDQEVRIFSRNLEELSAMFPEVTEATLRLPSHEAIFEGEVLAYNPSTEEFLPFQQTTRRRRKHGVEALVAELPLRLFAFDLLYADGADLMPLPYTKRRERLAALLGDRERDALALAPAEVVAEPEELERFFEQAISQGLEGIVAKKLDAPYQAGARNFNWVKLKRVSAGRLQDTVDCVILGYLYGRGKRAAFGVGALLVGVYDDERDEFATVTKIGTGLSDEEWRTIRERCDKITAPQRPARIFSRIEPSVWVEPQVVIEVLADEVTRSPMHTCGMRESKLGYALRFPRLISFRSGDKRPEDATTVREIIGLYAQQGRRTA